MRLTEAWRRFSVWLRAFCDGFRAGAERLSTAPHKGSSTLNSPAKGPGALLGLEFLGSRRPGSPAPGDEALRGRCSLAGACGWPSKAAHVHACCQARIRLGNMAPVLACEPIPCLSRPCRSAADWFPAISLGKTSGTQLQRSMVRELAET